MSGLLSSDCRVDFTEDFLAVDVLVATVVVVPAPADETADVEDVEEWCRGGGCTGCTERLASHSWCRVLSQSGHSKRSPSPFRTELSFRLAGQGPVDRPKQRGMAATPTRYCGRRERAINSLKV